MKGNNPFVLEDEDDNDHPAIKDLKNLNREIDIEELKEVELDDIDINIKDNSNRMAFTELDEKETGTRSYKSFDSERKPTKDGPRLDLSDITSESGAGTSRKEQSGRKSIAGGLNLSVHIDNLLANHLNKTGIDKARELFIPGLDEAPLDLTTGRNKREALDPMSRLESFADLPSVQTRAAPPTQESGKVEDGELKEIKVEPVEAQIGGNVGTWRTGFNMLKVFMGIGILATPMSF
jgi:hypothetical protein